MINSWNRFDVFKRKKLAVDVIVGEKTDYTVVIEWLLYIYYNIY